MTDLERLAYVIMPVLTIAAATLGSTAVFVLSRRSRSRAAATRTSVGRHAEIADAGGTRSLDRGSRLIRNPTIVMAILRVVEVAAVLGFFSIGRRR